MPDLSQPVKEILAHPPLQLLTPLLQPELLEGSGNLPRWDLANNSFRNGALFTVHTVPPGLSRTAANHPVYQLPLAIFYYHAFLRTGARVISRYDEMHTEEFLWLADNVGGDTVEYYVLPGVKLAWSYLIWTG